MAARMPATQSRDADTGSAWRPTPRSRLCARLDVAAMVIGQQGIGLSIRHADKPSLNALQELVCSSRSPSASCRLSWPAASSRPAVRPRTGLAWPRLGASARTGRAIDALRPQHLQARLVGGPQVARLGRIQFACVGRRVGVALSSSAARALAEPRQAEQTQPAIASKAEQSRQANAAVATRALAPRPRIDGREASHGLVLTASMPILRQDDREAAMLTT